MASKVYTLTPITCVHIGTGEILTPLDYKIAAMTENGEKLYWKFSSDRILLRLSDDEQAMASFEHIGNDGNMKELQDFFHDNCTCTDDVDYFCEITEGFSKTYEENHNKDANENAEKVFQMYHTKERNEKRQVPVIPGSSLKGSIRTALLNKYLSNVSDQADYQDIKMKIKYDKRPGNNENKLQQHLLGQTDARNTAKSDPLRAISIPDCPFMVGGLVGKLENVFFGKQTKNLIPTGIPIQAEVIKGKLLGGNAISEISIAIDDRLQETPFPSKRYNEPPKQIKKIDFKDIRESCNYFYWREFDKEYAKFFKDVSDRTKEFLDELKKSLEQVKNTNGQFIIRVGRWSQVEFVTFEENFRRPKVKEDRDGKPVGYGDTRTLFEIDGKYLPMGWCVLKEKGE